MQNQQETASIYLTFGSNDAPIHWGGYGTNEKDFRDYIEMEARSVGSIIPD